MADRAIEDLFEQYLAKKRETRERVRQETTLKRLRRPPPPLPKVVVVENSDEKNNLRKRKLSPNGYVSHYFQRGCKSSSASAEEDRVEVPQPCPSSPTISNRQVVKFDDIADMCVICCQTFDKNAETEVLEPCSHTFHADCIVRWKVENNSCPMCRSKIVNKVVPQSR